jgi:hypothetical protein
MAMLSATSALPTLELYLQNQHPNSNLRICLQQHWAFGFASKTLGICFRFKRFRILDLFTKYLALSNNEIWVFSQIKSA